MNAYPYTANFIGATGEYPINEKIDLTSNILNNKIVLTSNILNQKIDNYALATLQTISGVDNHYKRMIDEKIEVQEVLGISFNVKHTYIMNSNINTSFGEIRFYNQMASTFDINPLDPNPPPYKVKIATNGKLYLYYSYDPAIAATITGGWIDFNQLYGRLIADNINQGLTLAALQYEISTLSAAVSAAGTAVAIPNLGTGVPTPATVQATQSGLAANVYTVQSRIAATTGGGFAVAWGIGYAIFDAIKNNDLANAFVYQLKKNKQSNLDAGNTADADTIQTTIDYTCNNFFLSNLSNFNANFSNLSLVQGFLNSNIQTAQTLSNLNTYAITLNNQDINNIFLAKNGGTMYNSLVFQKSTSGNPVAGYFDGSGSRIIYEPSTTTTDYACSMGINNTTKNMWFSASSNYGYQWWVNGINVMSLSSSGNLTVGNIYNKTETDTLLNAKQNNLTFQSPLINTANTITLSTTNLITTAGGQTINGSLTTTGTITENGKTIPTIAQETILNSTPRVAKRTMITGTCSSSILMPDGITYFAYDIDLRTYTQTKTAPNPSTPYRIFTIKVFFGSVYFGFLTNNKPNVLSYEVYMSNESQGGGGGIGSAGLNVCAIGYPENVILNAISPTQLSLVCGDFNFISILSRVNGTVFNAIIEDCLA